MHIDGSRPEWIQGVPGAYLGARVYVIHGRQQAAYIGHMLPYLILYR